MIFTQTYLKLEAPNFTWHYIYRLYWNTVIMDEKGGRSSEISGSVHSKHEFNISNES